MSKERVLVVPGTFVPANDTVTLLVYKHLHNIDAEFDVVALKTEDDPTLRKKVEQDPAFSKFHVEYVVDYNKAVATYEKKNVLSGIWYFHRYCKAALAKAKSYPYKVVYTSSVPAFSHLAGYWIKKFYKDRITWVASLSDPLFKSPYKYDKETIREYSWIQKVGFFVYVHVFMNDHYEKLAQRYADKVVYVCEEQRDFSTSQYSCEYDCRQKSMIVPLNYMEAWDKDMLEAGRKDPTPHHPRIIAHMGRIYGLRKIDALLEALKILNDENPLLEQKIQFHQYGQIIDRYKQMIRNYHLEKVFICHPKVDHELAEKAMMEADGLALFDSLSPMDQIQPFLPSKTIEYLMLRKDLLVISTPKSGAWRILTKFGYTCCLPETEAVLKQVRELMANSPQKHNYDLSCFENRVATKELKEYIEHKLNS